MGRHVLRIDDERPLERLAGLVQPLRPRIGPGRAAFALGALEQGQTEFVVQPHIAAEVEAAAPHLLAVGLQDRAEVGDCLVHRAVLQVDQSREPGHGPARRRRLEGSRPLQRRDRVVSHRALRQVDAGEVERSVGAPQFLDPRERLDRLPQFAAAGAALAQQADAVVVPALPELLAGLPDRSAGRCRDVRAPLRAPGIGRTVRFARGAARGARVVPSRCACHSERHRVPRQVEDRQFVRRLRAVDVPQVGRVELPVAEHGLDRQAGGGASARRLQPVVEHVGGPGRNLVVVERHEDVLGVAPVDPRAVAVEHVDIDEVRPGIDPVALAKSAAAADQLAVLVAHGDVQPELVRIRRPLGQVVAQTERPHNDLQQVVLAGLEFRDPGPNRRDQLVLDPAARLDTEDVHVDHALVELPVRLDHPVRKAEQMGNARVRRREQVVVDLGDLRSLALRVAPGAEVLRRQQLHVAAVAIRLGLRRVVEARHAVPRHAREQVRVVVVLPAQELVVVQFLRQVDLVAGAAELGRRVQGLEEGPLVQLRLRLDQLLVDELEEGGVREGERVVLWLLDRVVGVAARAVDVGDRVAGRAGDPGVGGRLVDVEVRIVEGAGEEDHRIVAAGAEAGRLHVARALVRLLARLLHGEAVGRVVERAEPVGAVAPTLVDVGVAFDAVGVVHQRPLRDEAAARGARQRREEVLLARFRTLDVPGPRILELQHERYPDEHHGRRRHPPADPPVDPLAGKSVQHEQPRRHQRRQHVDPVGDAAHGRIVHRDHALDAGQHDAAEQERERRPEQRVADLHRPPVGPVAGVAHVRQAEPDDRHDEQAAHRQVEKEHRDVEPVLVRLACRRLGDANAGEVERVHGQQREQAEDHPQERLQPGADRRPVAASRGPRRRARVRGHGSACAAETGCAGVLAGIRREAPASGPSAAPAPVAPVSRTALRAAASISSPASPSRARSRRFVTA